MAGGFESTATVKAVKIDYDVTKQWGGWNPTWNMFLTVKYNDGQSWDKELEIYGNVKKELDASDEKSWGSAFKVRVFFESVLNRKGLLMNEDYTIPEQWLDDSIDKRFMVCSYKTTKMKKSGKPFWDTHKIVAPASSERGFLKKKVMKDVADGWIKNYATDDPATDFEEPASKDKDTADFDLNI